ncbi:MAG: hypothetical protein IJ320_06655 [Phascolarctobacterium sp.]|nr:hypothetical protein [Phascolarctobacterium sp.]
MKFTVNIKEVICETFKVEADSVEEALIIIKGAYDSGEIVLEPGELISTKATAYNEETGEWSEAVEF